MNAAGSFHPSTKPELRRRQREHDIIKTRARERQRERERDSDAGDGEVGVMAEYRPYRVINSAAQARLTQVKLIAVSGFMLLALLINWTSDAARGAAVRLCARARDRR